MNILNLKEYIGTKVSFKVLPNYKNPNDSFIIRNYSFNDNPYFKRYSYVYHENEIKVLIYTKTLYDYLNNCLIGFYGTKNGVFIARDTDDKFYAFTNLNNIITSRTKNNLYNNENIIKDTITEIVYHDRINFISMELGIDIVIDLKLKDGYLHLDNLHYEYGDPIFKTDEDKPVILAKYDKCGNIYDVIENYESENNLINLSEDQLKIVKQNYYNKRGMQIAKNSTYGY